MYLMGGPRQLFFFQCGPEMPKGWAPLKPILWPLLMLRMPPNLLLLGKIGGSPHLQNKKLLHWGSGVAHIPGCFWSPLFTRNKTNNQKINK